MTGLWKVPSYGKPRKKRAPSHSSWKTPMKPAFPTPPTAPASKKREIHKNEEPLLFAIKNRPRCPRFSSSMSSARSGGEGAEGG